MGKAPHYRERRQPSFSRPDGRDYFFGHDHLYSGVCLFADSGSVAERYEYDAYGACHVLEADFTADADALSDASNPYIFSGRMVHSDIQRQRS